MAAARAVTVGVLPTSQAKRGPLLARRLLCF